MTMATAVIPLLLLVTPTTFGLSDDGRFVDAAAAAAAAVRVVAATVVVSPTCVVSSSVSALISTTTVTMTTAASMTRKMRMRNHPNDLTMVETTWLLCEFRFNLNCC